METGLIISQVNPWLAYSPDGVIVQKEVPVSLLEIKCPLKGKDSDLQQTVENQIGSGRCLERKDGNIVVKKNHKYYGQVQLGMTVLNLKVTKFVLYSSFEDNILTLDIPIDLLFLSEMLTKLKEIYFNVILHEACLEEVENISVDRDDCHIEEASKVASDHKAL